MTAVVKWGILGTSFISEVMARAIQDSHISELTAIGSRSQDGAKQFADTFSIPKAYGDYESLLNDPEIDAIYLGLPNHVHKEWMIRAAHAGKHILCEKPLVTEVAHVHEVMDVVYETGVYCMEALMYRSHPFTAKIQEVMQSNALGEVKFYNAFYAADIAKIANPVAGGAIRNLGCYPISLIRLLAGAEPVDIQATGRLNPHNQTDSQASVLLTFADASMATVTVADDLSMAWTFEVHGTQGSLRHITNPWLPEMRDNKMVLTRHNGTEPVEITVRADKPLYTYQIDCLSRQILEKDSVFNDISLLDSLGNTTVLESWRGLLNGCQ